MMRPLGPLLRKMVPCTYTATTEGPHTGLCIQFQRAHFLWDVGDVAGISPQGLGPQGASGLMARSDPGGSDREGCSRGGLGVGHSSRKGFLSCDSGP